MKGISEGKARTNLLKSLTSDKNNDSLTQTQLTLSSSEADQQTSRPRLVVGTVYLVV